MRQALHHAIDRTAIIEAAYFGAGPVSVSLIAPGVLGWRDLEPVPYDPAKARALLTEAGFADGFKSTMTILDAPDQRTSAQIIQANLADVGIQCEILTYDGGTYWNLGLEEMGDDWKELQLILQQWTSSNDPNTTVTWFTPEQIGYWNWQRWNNTEFGELAKKGIAETDAAERDRIYARMVVLMNAWRPSCRSPTAPGGALQRQPRAPFPARLVGALPAPQVGRLSGWDRAPGFSRRPRIRHRAGCREGVLAAAGDPGGSHRERGGVRNRLARMVEGSA